MLLHSLRHSAGFPLSKEVLPSHQALQFWEFPHHLTDEIVLAEVGRTLGMGAGLGLQSQALRQQISEPLQTLTTIQQAAQPFSECHPFQLLAALGTGHSPIGIDEERGISQAGLEHPFIAAANALRCLIKTIGNAEELRLERVLGCQRQRVHCGVDVIEGHITLMRAHHGAEHLSRQCEGRLVDGALDQCGTLDQIGELLKQGGGDVRPGLERCSSGVNSFFNGYAPLPAINLHPCSCQGLAVCGGFWNLNGGGHQPVAAAAVAGRDHRVAALQGYRHNHLIEQGHEPADRTGETPLAGAPTHETPTLQSPHQGGCKPSLSAKWVTR